MAIAMKGLAQQETALENSSTNLNKIKLIQMQMEFQYEAMQQGSQSLGELKEQVSSMER